MGGQLKAGLLLAVMFGLGLVSGVALQRYQQQQSPVHHPYAERKVRHLKADLNLSPEQEQALHEIFQKAHERAKQVNEEVAWDLSDIHRDSLQAIYGVLTPEQVAKFEKMHKKEHAHHEAGTENAGQPKEPSRSSAPVLINDDGENS